MSEKSPIGSYVIAIRHRELSWAVTEIIRTLYPDRFNKLKVWSGEHLAAILITAFLGATPRSVDFAGETDLIFKIPRDLPKDALGRRLGLGNKPFADFEVKSLPGVFREYDAAIERAQKAGKGADERPFKTPVTSANTVLHQAPPTILKAKNQLDKKGKPGHSKNIFLIAHPFDYHIIELYENESPLIAHLLEPLGDLDGIDSVWVLWAPTHLAVWSSEHKAWTNLIFEAVDPSDATPPSRDESIALLQQVEEEFLKQTGYPRRSPYVFVLTYAGDEATDCIPGADGK
jgi:hypothetical protein